MIDWLKTKQFTVLRNLGSISHNTILSNLNTNRPHKFIYSNSILFLKSHPLLLCFLFAKPNDPPFSNAPHLHVDPELRPSLQSWGNNILYWCKAWHKKFQRKTRLPTLQCIMNESHAHRLKIFISYIKDNFSHLTQKSLTIVF